MTKSGYIILKPSKYDNNIFESEQKPERSIRSIVPYKNKKIAMI